MKTTANQSQNVNAKPQISLSRANAANRAIPLAGPTAAHAIQLTQIDKYHTLGGPGFAAEDGNALSDRIRLRKVEITGPGNQKNGADRIVNGALIQTKYYPNAKATVEHAFDPASGRYRYPNQALEVPKDQFAKCVDLMREKIAGGLVPGVADPNQADRIVKRGSVTFRQAQNIARAGNVDSLVYDAKTNSVGSLYVFAISFAIQFAKRKWDGEKTDAAIRDAVQSALEAGSITLVTGVITSQILRTRIPPVLYGRKIASNGVKLMQRSAAGRKFIESMARASFGQAATTGAFAPRLAKLMRTNLVASTVATVVTATPDFYRAAISRCISWPQFTKNLLTNVAGMAGGTAGWWIGMAFGGPLGGTLAALGLGYACTKLAGLGLAKLIVDDAKRMVELLRKALADVAEDYLLAEAEIEILADKVKDRVDAAWLRNMYRAGCKTNSDADRRRFAYDYFEPFCCRIVARRAKVRVPDPARVMGIVERILQGDGPEPELPADAMPAAST